MNMKKCFALAVTLTVLCASMSPAALIITEIMHSTGTGNENWQFIEIYNDGTADIALGNMSAVGTQGGILFGNLNTTLAAGEVAVLYNGSADFANEWLLNPDVVANLIQVPIWSDPGLDNDAFINFADSGGLPAGSVDMGAGVWPTPTGGLSIYYSDLYGPDNSTYVSGDNWSLSEIGGWGDGWTGWASESGLLGSPGVIPEPGSIGLAIMALAGGAAAFRKRKEKQATEEQPAVA